MVDRIFYVGIRNEAYDTNYFSQSRANKEMCPLAATWMMESPSAV
jgi:hypothetical protein